MELEREPVVVIGFVLTVLAEVAVAIQGLGWQAAILAALPIIASGFERRFVRPVPKGERGQ